MSAVRSCAECSASLEGRSPRAKFCGDACRKAANRRPAKVGLTEAPTAPVEPAASGLVAAVTAELTDLEVLGTVDGQTALALAERIVSPMETGSAAASMTRELAACMDRVRAAAAPKQRDGVDELLGSARGKLRVVG